MSNTVPCSCPLQGRCRKLPARELRMLKHCPSARPHEDSFCRKLVTDSYGKRMQLVGFLACSAGRVDGEDASTGPFCSLGTWRVAAELFPQQLTVRSQTQACRLVLRAAGDKRRGRSPACGCTAEPRPHRCPRHPESRAFPCEGFRVRCWVLSCCGFTPHQASRETAAAPGARSFLLFQETFSASLHK